MEIEKYIQAGKIAAKVLKFASSIAKENTPLLEIAESIEEKIVELGGKLAFPANICINHIAAHDTPLHDDKRVLCKEDLVKIDIGVHIDGYIADCAISLQVNTNKHSKLIQASENALANVIKNLNPSTKLFEIGDIIEKEITSLGFCPIRNLSGHEIDCYNLHAGLTIPNYNNRNKSLLPKAFAIEPFATPGSGIVTEGKPSGIYMLLEAKPVRNVHAREILKFIVENYKTLPFAKRWLVKKFGLLKTNLALLALEKEKIVKQFSTLVEKTKQPVSQKEHTFIIKEDKVVVTTLSD